MAGHVRFGAKTGGALVILGTILISLALFFSDSVSIIFRIFPNAILGVILFFAGSELAIVVKDIGDKKSDFYVMLIVAAFAMWNMGVAFLVGVILDHSLRRRRERQRATRMVDPDLALVDATGRGDLEAFESLVKRYQCPLLNFIARVLGDRAMAEDLTQEVFLRIYRAAPRFEARTKVSTWIFRIAYNLALNEMDRRRRQRDLCKALRRNREESTQESITHPAERYELEEEIMAALGRLSGNQRAALLLRVNEGLSYREIGEVLGTGIQSVESLLFRARKNLRQSLGRTKKQGAEK